MGEKLDAVFEGGGVKGVALIGAASVVEEAGYSFENLAGTSAGAIVATLLAAGYSAAELKPIIMSINFTQFEDASWFGKIPLIGPTYEMIRNLGLYRGDDFLNTMRKLLDAKGVHTFRDLIMPNQEDPRYRYKVRVVASDISRGRMVVLPQDIRDYHQDPDDVEVALAVRMSMSIPYFFQPITLKNPVGQTCYIVDGALLSNFPVELFDEPDPPSWPTFGFCLVPPNAPPASDQPVINQVGGPITMLWSMFMTATEAHDAQAASIPSVSARTIKIDDLNISPIDFNLTALQNAALYDSGRAAAKAFLDHWSFPDYITQFRSGQFENRRQAILQLPTTSMP
jgi:NTE family protein